MLLLCIFGLLKVVFYLERCLKLLHISMDHVFFHFVPRLLRQKERHFWPMLIMLVSLWATFCST